MTKIKVKTKVKNLRPCHAHTYTDTSKFDQKQTVNKNGSDQKKCHYPKKKKGFEACSLALTAQDCSL